MPETRKCALFLTGLLALLSGCATVRPDCPQVPQPPQRVELGPAFLPRMQMLLSGKLPEQIDYGLSLPPAKTANGPFGKR